MGLLFPDWETSWENQVLGKIRSSDSEMLNLKCRLILQRGDSEDSWLHGLGVQGRGLGQKHKFEIRRCVYDDNQGEARWDH